MKRVLLSVLMVCLYVGQASAEMYTLDYATALSFRQLFPTGSSGLLEGVFNGSTFVYQNEWLPATEYPSAMQGDVGFVGGLSGDLSWMRIGATGSFGTYAGFGVFVANDNQNTWEVRLVTNAVTPTDNQWVSIAAGDSAWLHLDFASTALTMIGFDVRLNAALADPPSLTDSFHVSVVPLQGGVILGMLGLAAAGLKLRRFM